MATIRVLLAILCFSAFGGLRVFSRSFIGYENVYERSNQARAVIAAAKREIGVREITENSSPRIDQYLDYVGFKKVAWCAAWVSFCFGQAGYKEPRTAWCPALFPTGRLARDALPGMVMGIYFEKLGRIAHVGIVERVKGAYLYTIEGNTNVAGSREGDGVMRKLRHKRTIAKYADWL